MRPRQFRYDGTTWCVDDYRTPNSTLRLLTFRAEDGREYRWEVAANVVGRDTPEATLIMYLGLAMRRKAEQSSGT